MDQLPREKIKEASLQKMCVHRKITLFCRERVMISRSSLVSRKKNVEKMKKNKVAEVLILFLII